MENKKTGFAAHPENINRNGRPKKGETMTDILEAKLDELRFIIDGKEYTGREAWAIKMINKAIMDDSLAAQKHIGNRIDGMPTQKQNIDMNDPKMDAILDAVRNGIVEDE